MQLMSYSLLVLERKTQYQKDGTVKMIVDTHLPYFVPENLIRMKNPKKFVPIILRKDKKRTCTKKLDKEI